MFKAKLGVRGQILSIALVPSLALLLVGLWIATALLIQGRQAENWAAEIDRNTAPGMDFAVQAQNERRLTLIKVGGDDQHDGQLTAQRARVDGAIQTIIAAGQRISHLNGTFSGALTAARSVTAQLPSIRQRADAGTLTVDEAYSYFNQLTQVAAGGMEMLTRAAPTSETAAEESDAARLFHIAEAMSKGNALAAAAVTGNKLSTGQLLEYGRQVGFYHSEISNLEPQLNAQEQASVRALSASDPWRRLAMMEDAIAQRGIPPLSSQATTGRIRDTSEPAPLPLTVADWQDAATQVSTELIDLWQTQNHYALRSAAEHGQTIARNSLLGGGAALLVSVAAFLIATWLAARTIRRLRRLRHRTLALADDQLPRITERLRAGRPVDLETDVARLDFGTDEVGQVADAFNRAQLAAITAAVSEARTRAGVNALFLNIAYRSQLVIHRQLEVLDQAERELDDPVQLELLFKLDHLATRERRNAENLIILSGGQPGRRWRNPVPLLDLVRSAVTETKDYARVWVIGVPEGSVAGTAVADLIHLLAELVDNATSFSPPESRVEITGNVVGKGILVEVSDQGLGMAAADIQRVNETLSNPPDFSVTNLSDDSRLGLFVVALLAARHKVSVRLAESHYGGIRAIVVIPSELISTAAASNDHRTAVDVPATRAADPAPNPPEPEYQPMVFHHDTTNYPVPETAPATEQVATAPSFWNPASVDPRGGDKPPLPRRRRQQSLAPELAQAPPPPTARGSETDSPQRPRSADQARNLISAIETGTRQGRQLRPDITTYDPEGLR
ncbi:sensor histidine kinase [Nocardia miyunensis]|uniref:sensor histidine kinase n=1 Tax=Nocardia miyunensis TaxID=282684 RepID=UPI000B22BC7F|nr:nitrate- and nitrite sensing domain-containing protein [Nocardia miyunensis]